MLIILTNGEQWSKNGALVLQILLVWTFIAWWKAVSGRHFGALRELGSYTGTSLQLTKLLTSNEDMEMVGNRSPRATSIGCFRCYTTGH